MILFILLALVQPVYSQTCSDTGIGLCLGGDQCPPGYTCIDGGKPSETCCDNNNVVPVATPTPTTAPTTGTPATPTPSNCVDKTNPKTGTSDCQMRTQYCQNTLYFDLMTDQCPKTCGRCSTSGTSGNCQDKTNPSTGTTDCPQKFAYCTNTIYFDFMTQQCPKTCNRCPTGSTGTGSAQCADKVNPSTGISDCPQRTQYCQNSLYFDLMTDQCPQTCGRCSIGGTRASCVDKVNPSTGISDCPQRMQYCQNTVYFSLMTDQCPKTCGRCT